MLAGTTAFNSSTMLKRRSTSAMPFDKPSSPKKQEKAYICFQKSIARLEFSHARCSAKRLGGVS